MKIFLATYAVKIRKKNEVDDYREFGSFDGTHDLLDVLQEFLERLRNTHSNDESSKVLHGAERIERDDTSLWGLLNSGDYGYTTRIVDVATNTTAYRRNANQAELYPYYFLLHLPPGQRHGILIVQRAGSRGILTVFEKAIREYLSTRYNCFFELHQHVPKEVYDYFTKGHIKSVVFNKFTLPKDTASMVGWDIDELAEVAEVRLVVKAKSRKELPFSEMLNTRRTSLYSQKSSHQNIDNGNDEDINVVVRYRGKERTVNLKSPDKIAPHIDIDSEVKKVEGHPEFESIHQCAQDVLMSLLQEMGDPDVC